LSYQQGRKAEHDETVANRVAGLPRADTGDMVDATGVTWGD
jgi:hypothetical protein